MEKEKPVELGWEEAGKMPEGSCQAERQEVFFLRKKKSEMATDVADLPPG